MVPVCFLRRVYTKLIVTQPLLDIYYDFRGDEANSLRNALDLRDNDYRDIYDNTRFEDVLQSRREARINCRW